MHERVRVLNAAPVRTSGARYVLYSMLMNRRAAYNHALEFAAGLAKDRDLPLVCYEGLDCEYPNANDRLHTFILEGVPETARRLRKRGIGYIFYLRRTPSDPRSVLYRLARDAAVVVADDYPTFVAARYNRSVPAKLDIPYYVVDASCVVPAVLIDKRQPGAFTFRKRIAKLLPKCLHPLEPVRRLRSIDLNSDLHTEVTAENIPSLVASCAIDHSVPPSPAYRGGAREAERRLDAFVRERLHRYAAERNEPAARVTSGLSPYLHFGQISALEVALRTIDSPEFLEELIVRRELCFNFCRFAPDHDSLNSLPAWAQATLRAHARDKRPYLYSLDELLNARTHDPLWNATQREMLTTGTIVPYYRMYWGKKIFEWSRTHAEALATMLHIHDRWALDGRDPNTYANCLWCFGLHDRPFPERDVFGKIRYMSYDGMRRKTDVEAYIRQMESIG